MSNTHISLQRWERGEWPDCITVSHEGMREPERRYVPERTCRIVSYVDKSPSSFGGVVHRCSSCGKALPKALFRNGWTRLDYCPRCGAKVVEG